MDRVHAAALLVCHAEIGRGSGKLTPCDATSRPRRTFINWLTSYQVMSLLEDKVLTTDSPELAKLLSEASLYAEVLRSDAEDGPQGGGNGSVSP